MLAREVQAIASLRRRLPLSPEVAGNDRLAQVTAALPRCNPSMAQSVPAVLETGRDVL